MKAAIGIYLNHDDAMADVEQLKNDGFPVNRVSILGTDGTEVLDKQMHISTRRELTHEGVSICIGAGAITGILTGLGLFAIPGLGELRGEGTLIGAIAGADLGLLAGMIITVLYNYSIRERLIQKYEKELAAGKYLVVASGSSVEIGYAMAILYPKEVISSLGTYLKDRVLAPKGTYAFPSVGN